MALDDLLDAESLTLKEHVFNIFGRGFNVLADGEKVATIKRKQRWNGRYDFKLHLADEEETYIGMISEKVYLPGHLSVVYDADGDKLCEFKWNFVKEKVRNPFKARMWGDMLDSDGTLLARVDKHKGSDPLHFDIYAANNRSLLGAVDQREHLGSHSFGVSGQGLDKGALVLFAALMDELYHHTDTLRYNG